MITLFSDDSDHYSHRIRIALAEKDIEYDVVTDGCGKTRLGFDASNPYEEVPVLVDRELCLYEPDVILNYLEERYPHPHLYPIDPTAKAQCRLALYRINRDWVTLIDHIVDVGKEQYLKSTKIRLAQSIVEVSEIFAAKPYFLSDTYTVCDLVLGTIFWRLPELGVVLPKRGHPALCEYQERIFARPAFKRSLSDAERGMR